MKRIDLLEQRTKLWEEIEALKNAKELCTKNKQKSVEIDEKIKILKNKHNFINNLLKVNNV